MDGNFVVGLTPTDGWQVNPVSFSKIGIGLYTMLNRVSKQCDWMDKKLLKGLTKKYYKQLIFSGILIKKYHIDTENGFLQEVESVIKNSLFHSLIFKVVFKVPEFFAAALIKLILIRRKVRNSLFGISAQGPEIDKI